MAQVGHRNAIIGVHLTIKPIAHLDVLVYGHKHGEGPDHVRTIDAVLADNIPMRCIISEHIGVDSQHQRMFDTK
jgi:hypothetical protein